MTSCLRLILLCFLTTTFLQCPTQCILVAQHRCIFDDIRPHAKVGRSRVTYSQSTVRSRRSVTGLFRPIRLTAVIQDLDHVVDTSNVERVKTVVTGATSIVSKVLSVVPVKGPLVISRSKDACSLAFHAGININKCAEISLDYVGEKCLDGFLIPNEHLEGLWTWNSTHTEPAHQIHPPGQGLLDTDTVLYVKTEHTSQCNNGQIVAYASYCKLDQHDRPIAGVINFCPEHLQDDMFEERQFIVLAVHEIFHVLGFSAGLFNKFKECSVTAEGLNCINRRTTTGTDSQGLHRLITSVVTTQSQRHFGCLESGFGGPLENQAGDAVSSHWETRMMYGSIMAPVVNQPHQTFLDNLTLAVFEDSGWYKVNYEYAESFPWGRNQGCEFGGELDCQTTPNGFFCNDSSSGCHYLHMDKGRCSSNNYLDDCRVTRANKEDQCTVQDDGSSSMYGENFHENSRCFVSNAVKAEVLSDPSDLKGTCYLTRCDNQSTAYEVKVGEADWVQCPDNTVITIPGYRGSVHCPPASIICAQKTSLFHLVDEGCSTTLQPPLTDDKTTFALIGQSLGVNLEIGKIDFSEFDGEDEIEAFSRAVVTGICGITNIKESRIRVQEVAPGSSTLEMETDFVCVTFDIDQADDSNDLPAHEAYRYLVVAVSNKQMQVRYLDMNYTAISIRLISRDLFTPSIPQNTETTLTARSPIWIALGACLALLATVITLACICHKAKRSNAVGPDAFDTTSMGTEEYSPDIACKYVV